MKKYNKLVRDKIPEILEEKRVRFKTHIATKKEYLDKLYEKLIEELEEFKVKPNMEEFADMLEVIDFIGKYYNFNLVDIKNVKKTKKEKKGGFNERIILDETD
jgi:predicted house-cleaning noncanonical NTP pyrophosphatase (MazG superfamily)